MVCADPAGNEEGDVSAFIAEIEPLLSAFPFLGEGLERHITELCLAEKLHTSRGYFEPETGRIVLDRGLAPGLRQAVLVHELRHAQQFATGDCPSPDLSMAENARAVFAMEADASAISLVVSWSLREVGRPEMWDALAAWPLQRDIAGAFEAEMTATGDPGAAASAAFAQWYEDDTRRDAYYVAICSGYLDEQDRTHRLPTYGALDRSFFADLCVLPDGRSYACGDGRPAAPD